MVRPAVTLAALVLACTRPPARGELQPTPPPATPTSPGASWREPGPLVCVGPTDVPLAEGGEASLLPFQAERQPVAAARYDACVADGVCAERTVAQPPGHAPAVGMRWDHTHEFCLATGMRAQTPEQDLAMRWEDLERPPVGLGEETDPAVVVSGFRCVRLECPP